jgi:hypothetical protein
VSFLHGEPTAPSDDFVEKHATFESPTIPLYPVKQLPHVFEDVTQFARFNLAQYAGVVSVQLMVLNDEDAKLIA